MYDFIQAAAKFLRASERFAQSGTKRNPAPNSRVGNINKSDGQSQVKILSRQVKKKKITKITKRRRKRVEWERGGALNDY